MKKFVLSIVTLLAASFVLFTQLAPSAESDSAEKSKVPAAQNGSADKPIPEAVQNVIDQAISAADSVRESKIPGIYEVWQMGRVFYIDAQGRFLIYGNNLIDTVKMKNVTEESMRSFRKGELSKLTDNEQLIFKPDEQKYQIYVFTDIECGYCRKFHQDIEKLMRMGVEVRYLFAPFRGNIAVEKATAVWCANDKQKAMTRAKQGRDIDMRKCPTPISKHKQLAGLFSIGGTPFMVLEHGTRVNGYVEPDELMQLIHKDQLTASES